jgi:hypothetical protein
MPLLHSVFKRESFERLAHQCRHCREGAKRQAVSREAGIVSNAATSCAAMDQARRS